MPTVRTYDARLRRFFKWAKRRKCSPREATLRDVTDFLMEIFDGGLAVSTVRHYRSAIASIHDGFPDGSTLGTSDIITSLLRGMFHTRPTSTRLAPSWSINEVLVALARAPYEPMTDISLADLTRKTVFLVSAASARRCGTIHALTTKEGFLRIDHRGATLLTDPSFLAKNQTVTFTPDPIYIERLQESSATLEAKRWCPVRALLWYLSKTKHLRTSKQLFIKHY